MSNLPHIVENILDQRYQAKLLLEKEELVTGPELGTTGEVAKRPNARPTQPAEFKHPLRSQFIDAVKKYTKQTKDKSQTPFDENSIVDENGNLKEFDYDTRNAALKALYNTPGFADTLSVDEYKRLSALQKQEGLEGVIIADREKYFTRPLIVTKTGDDTFESLPDDMLDDESDKTKNAKFVAPAHISYSKLNDQSFYGVNLPQVGVRVGELLSHPSEIGGQIASGMILGKLFKGLGWLGKTALGAAAEVSSPVLTKMLGKDAAASIAKIAGSAPARQIGSKIVPGALAAGGAYMAGEGISSEAEPIKTGEGTYILPATSGTKTVADLAVKTGTIPLGYGTKASRVRPSTEWATKSTTIPAEYETRDVIGDVEEPIFSLRTGEPKLNIPSRGTQRIVRGMEQGRPTISTAEGLPLPASAKPLDIPPTPEAPGTVGPQGRSFMDFIKSMGEKGERKYKTRSRGETPKVSMSRPIKDINELSPEMRAKVQKWIEVWNDPYSDKSEIPEALQAALRAQAEDIKIPSASSTSRAPVKVSREKQIGAALTFLGGLPAEAGVPIETAATTQKPVISTTAAEKPQLVQTGTRTVKKVVGKETVKVSDEKIVKELVAKDPIKTPFKTGVSKAGQTVVQSAAVTANTQQQAAKSEFVAPSKVQDVERVQDQSTIAPNEEDIVSKSEESTKGATEGGKGTKGGKGTRFKGKDVPVPPVIPPIPGGGGSDKSAGTEPGRGSTDDIDPRLGQGSYGGGKAVYYRLA